MNAKYNGDNWWVKGGNIDTLESSHVISQHGWSLISSTKCKDKMQYRARWDGKVLHSLVIRPMVVVVVGSVERLVHKMVVAYICRPLKINRCCGGGTPDCSSTFSLIRVIYREGIISVSTRTCRSKRISCKDSGAFLYPADGVIHLILRIDIKFDLQ